MCLFVLVWSCVRVCASHSHLVSDFLSGKLTLDQALGQLGSAAPKQAAAAPSKPAGAAAAKH